MSAAEIAVFIALPTVIGLIVVLTVLLAVRARRRLPRVEENQQ